jgi:Uncharacterized conserved protein
MKPILLSAIACPKCHGGLQYDEQHQQLICQSDMLVYAVKEGIPVLLESEAQPLVQPPITQE